MAACSRDPESARRDYLARGDRYVEQKKLREAVIEYRNAVNADGRSPVRPATSSLTHTNVLAISRTPCVEFVRAADLLPERDDIQLKAAQYLLQSGSYDDAKRIATALLKKNAGNLNAKLVLANSLAGLKDLPAAIKELEAALTLDPRRLETYMNLAALSFRQREPGAGRNGSPKGARSSNPTRWMPGWAW